MRYCGIIGYGETREDAPGVWKEHIIEERTYYGDVLKNSKRFQSSGQVNDDMIISNEFSIIADPYALEKFSFMRYIVYMGVKWKIASIEIQYPRMIINVGGVYNG